MVWLKSGQNVSKCDILLIMIRTSILFSVLWFVCRKEFGPIMSVLWEVAARPQCTHTAAMLRVWLCPETALWSVCVRWCVWERERKSGKPHRRKKSILNVMKMQIVYLVSTCAVNQHHSSPSPFNPSQNGPLSAQTWLGQITPPSHFHHSLQINQSPLLLCSLLVSIPYSSIDFRHPSICLNCFVFISPFSRFPPSHPWGDFLIVIKQKFW